MHERLSRFTGRLLVLLALLYVAQGLTACNSRRNAREAVHVDGLRLRLMPGGARILTGELVNDGKDTIPIAQIEVSLFDTDNVRVSSMIVVVTDVEAGGRKAFREPVDSRRDVQGVRVKDILIP